MKLCAVLVLAACSGGGGDGAADAAGSGGNCPANVVNGTVSDGSVTHTFGPIARAFEAYQPGNEPQWLILLDEQPSPDGGCSTLPQTGFNLALVLAAAPAPGTYTIILPGSGGSGSADALAIAQQDGDANLAIASSGSLVIDSIANGCIAGHYTSSYDNGQQLAGTFGAATCR